MRACLCLPGSSKNDLVILLKICSACGYACIEDQHKMGLRTSPFWQTPEGFYKALQAVRLENLGDCPADLQN